MGCSDHSATTSRRESLLAYYYVSWKQAMPELVENLQLPYGKEYGMAVQLCEGRREGA